MCKKDVMELLPPRSFQPHPTKLRIISVPKKLSASIMPPLHLSAPPHSHVLIFDFFFTRAREGRPAEILIKGGGWRNIYETEGQESNHRRRGFGEGGQGGSIDVYAVEADPYTLNSCSFYRRGFWQACQKKNNDLQVRIMRVRRTKQRQKQKHKQRMQFINVRLISIHQKLQV